VTELINTVAVRAVRGAIQVDADTAQQVAAGTRELLVEVMARNRLVPDDVISVIFTVTTDLTSGFPAAAARPLGLSDVPLLCATEIEVPGSLPRVVRLLAHVETPLPRSAIQHVYLRGATALRPDLARTRSIDERTASSWSS
jgi:chorismate mutase